MKKVALLFSALALVLGLSQCKKVRPDMPHYSGPVGDMYIQHVTVGASYDDGNNSSKVSAAKPIGKELKLTWDENDKLKVQVKGASSSIEDLVLQPESAGSSSGKFDGTITAPTGSKLMFLYVGENAVADVDYTFNKDGLTVNPDNFMNQNGLIQPTKDPSTYSVMQKLILFADTIDFKAQEAAEYSANMIVPYAILKLDLSKLGTTGDGSTVTVNDGTNNIATILNVKEGSKEMYVALPTDNLYDDKDPEEVTYTFTNDSKKSIAMKWKIQQNYFYTAKDTDGAAIEVKPEPNYVCFEALANNSSVELSAMSGMAYPSGFKYSTDGVNWDDFNGTVNLNAVGNKCYLKTTVERKAIKASFFGMDFVCKFSGSGNLKVSGNIMALLNSENPATEMTSDYNNCFGELFSGCTVLSDASELVLPATTLAASCYASMFSGCTNLTAAPDLPATTLAANCYDQMFNGCTSLVDAPAMSISGVAAFCCRSMFKGCTSLEDTSEITLSAADAECCYNEMFANCSKLTTAPNMSITAVADNCCNNMFCGCSSLTDASNISLNAKTLANNCYFGMFGSSSSKALCCSSLKYAPTMSATTAAFQCCDQMFIDCSKLEDVSKITFAETVAERCYDSMFEGCESLESVSELPAVNLENYCYHTMFNGCAKLSSVTMKATDISGATGCLLDWLEDAGTSAISPKVYVANSNMKTAVEGTVPSGWTVEVKQ